LGEPPDDSFRAVGGVVDDDKDFVIPPSTSDPAVQTIGVGFQCA